MTEPPFKRRLGNHNRDCNNAVYKNKTELSKYVWSLKDAGKTPSVKYEILYAVQGKPRLDFCRLCTTEKLAIIDNLGDNSYLNKRSEFISKCRHTNKYMICLKKDSKD